MYRMIRLPYRIGCTLPAIRSRISVALLISNFTAASDSVKVASTMCGLVIPRNPTRA